MRQPLTFERVFENNRAWVAKQTQEDPQYFEKLSGGSTPRFSTSAAPTAASPQKT